jgi:hypothetical protein
MDAVTMPLLYLDRTFGAEGICLARSVLEEEEEKMKNVKEEEKKMKNVKEEEEMEKSISFNYHQ